MSRLGKLAVALPEKVSATVEPTLVLVKGPKGELETPITSDVTVSVEDNQLWVKPANDGKRAKAMWGTVRSNVNNLVIGVTEGFTKTLEIKGVGFRAAVQGQVLSMSLGFSHDVKYILPEGVSAKVEKQTTIILESINKQKLGQVASEIRSLRKPEPYKGKGVKYADEVIVRKEGKKK
jgi:large subunit ribosomal protein L6